jgi:acyl carrier protein
MPQTPSFFIPRGVLLYNLLAGRFFSLRRGAASATPSVSRSKNEVTVSSRTPEGFPSHCPLCGAATNLEFSQPSGDAPCPNCGHLLWRSAELLSSFQRQLSDYIGVASDNITPSTPFAELGADSLDTVELVMELEEEFDISIPDDVAERLRTVGDVIRYIEEQRRRQGG